MQPSLNDSHPPCLQAAGVLRRFAQACLRQEQPRPPSMLEAALGPAEYAARMQAAAAQQQKQQQGMEEFTRSPARPAGPGCGAAAEPPHPLQALLDAGSRAGPEPEGAQGTAQLPFLLSCPFALLM